MMQAVRPLFPWQGLVRWALAVGLLAMVGWQLRGQLDQLQHHAVSVSWPWLVVAAAGLLLYFAGSAEGWRRLVGGLGAQLGFRQAFYVLFSSNLAKYLPGGVWNMVGRVALAQRLGVSPAQCSASLLLEIACQVTAALGVALLTLPALAGHVPLPPWWAIAGVVGAAAVGLHPFVMNTALGLGERVLRRPFPRLEVPYSFVLAMLGYYALNWLLLGASFAALGQALAPAGLSAWQGAVLVGSFGIAWNVGVFAFFFPAGLGVREVALVTLLGAAFPLGWPAMLALAARVWILLGEVACFGLALAWREAGGDRPE